MAQLVSTTQGLILKLSRWERLGSLHSDLMIPWENVESISSVEDLWSQLRGIRAPGTGIPGVIMLGTARYRGAKDFCAVYKHHPGVIVVTKNEAYARLLVTTDQSVELPIQDR
jgi:hypothetical protein